MSETQDKIQRIKDLQQELKSIHLGQEDRISIVRPFMEALAQYGVTSLTIKVPLPSFNDGDPCYPYVSETLECYSEELEEMDETFLQELESYAAEDSFRQVINLTGRNPDVKPAQVQALCREMYKTFEMLLEADKLSSSVKYTYRLDGDVFTEKEEAYYVY